MQNLKSVRNEVLFILTEHIAVWYFKTANFNSVKLVEIRKKIIAVDNDSIMPMYLQRGGNSYRCSPSHMQCFVRIVKMS